MLLSLATLCLVLAGLLLVLGVRSWSKRLLLLGVVMAVIASLPYACLSFSIPSLDSAIIWLIIMGLAVLLLLAWLRFRNHHQKLDSLFQAKPTSAKRRVDR